jgi:lysozyme
MAMDVKELTEELVRDEARYLLGNDIGRVCCELDQAFPWWRQLSDRRQRALANMAFNLGAQRLRGFAKMIKALASAQYDEAARQALESKWARQVGARAERIAAMIREG